MADVIIVGERRVRILFYLSDPVFNEKQKYAKYDIGLCVSTSSALTGFNSDNNSNFISLASVIKICKNFRLQIQIRRRNPDQQHFRCTLSGR